MSVVPRSVVPCSTPFALPVFLPRPYHNLIYLFTCFLCVYSLPTILKESFARPRTGLCSLLYKLLEQYLAHSRCSINMNWIDWISYYRKKNIQGHHYTIDAAFSLMKETKTNHHIKWNGFFLFGLIQSVSPQFCLSENLQMKKDKGY